MSSNINTSNTSNLDILHNYLNNEYETIVKTSRQGLATIHNIIIFFKTIKNYKETYHNNIIKSINDLITISDKDKENNFIQDKIVTFYKEFEIMNKHNNLLISKIDKEIIELDTFFQHKSNSNKLNSDKIKEVLSE